MTKINTKEWGSIAEDVATQHVEWLLDLLKPLLIEHMIHGFKHGIDFAKSSEDTATVSHTTLTAEQAIREHKGLK